MCGIFYNGEGEMKRPLGELLIEAGMVDDIQVTVALGMQKQTGLKLGMQLLKLGFLSEAELTGVLRRQLGIKKSLVDMDIDSEAVEAVPQHVAFHHKVMPVSCDGRTVIVATSEPSNLKMMDTISFQIGKIVKPMRALEWDIDNALIKHYLDFSDDELERLTHESKEARQYRQEMSTSFGNITTLAPSSPSAEPAPAVLEELMSPQEEADGPGGYGDMETTVEKLSALETTSYSEGEAAPVRAPAKEGLARQTDRPKKKANLQHALIDLLIRKKLISEKELLEVLMSLEQNPRDK
jgi:hypothetical protein